MLSKLSRKVTVALIALVVYSTIVSVVISIFDNEEYLTFASLWFAFFMLSAPLFIIAGVAVAFIMEKINLKVMIKGFLYILIGAILILPYGAYIFEVTAQNAINYMIFGAAAGLIFYVVQWLFETYLYKQQTVISE